LAIYGTSLGILCFYFIEKRIDQLLIIIREDISQRDVLRLFWYLLNIRGIPPFALFFVKITIVISAIEYGINILVIILLLRSGIFLLVYIRFFLTGLLLNSRRLTSTYRIKRVSRALFLILLSLAFLWLIYMC